MSGLSGVDTTQGYECQCPDCIQMRALRDVKPMRGTLHTLLALALFGALMIEWLSNPTDIPTPLMKWTACLMVATTLGLLYRTKGL